MAVRSKQLALWVGGATINTAVDIYTVGSGETVVLRSVAAYWRTGTAGTARFGFKTGGGASINLHQFSFAANNEGQVWEHWFVLNPGDVIFVRHSVANGVFLVFSGAELEGVAD